MTMPIQHMYVCPHCEQKSPFTIWNSVNVTLNPELKPKILDQSAFTFHCPYCGKEFQVNYDMLYHDMDKHLMLHLAMSDASEDEIYKMLITLPKEERKMLEDGQYQVRIVRSHNDLNEKIMIFDAGRDDRLIEICKLIFLSALSKQGHDINNLHLLYEKNDEGERIDIFADNKLQGAIDMRPGFYEDVAEKYGDSLDSMRAEDFLVDQQWAADRVSLFGKNLH